MKALSWAKRAAVGLGAVAGLAVLTGTIYERVGRNRAWYAFPAPGRLVDVGGGRRLHLDCRGAGSPTVVLEAGLDSFGSLAWASVHDSIATTTRVCAYSRPGIMWSDPVDGPFDAAAVERDLHAALINSGESAPWVMVGHSIGGPLVMMFSSLYDAEVVGVVLVDPSHPDQFARFREIAGKPMEPKSVAVHVGASLAWTGLVRVLPKEKQAGNPVAVNRIPPTFLPTSLAELAREVDAIPALLGSTSTLRSLGDRPLVVLTSTREQSEATLKAMGVTRAQGAALLAASRVLHEDQARWSSRGRHEVIDDASHYIQFDRPDRVVAAVRSVIVSTRQSVGLASRDWR
jgi:pimeloyl-ACP methyl ester carboxylesterase